MRKERNVKREEMRVDKREKKTEEKREQIMD